MTSGERDENQDSKFKMARSLRSASNPKKGRSRRQPTPAESDHGVADYRHHPHQRPGRHGNPVPPSGLRISLRVQHVIHAGNHQCQHGIRLSRGRRPHRVPQLLLQPESLAVDIVEPPRIARAVERNTLCEVALEQATAPTAASAVGNRSARRYSVPMALASASS